MHLVMLQPTSTTSISSTISKEDSKYTVADILTSFTSASGELATPTSGIFTTGIATSELLTPGTLENLEQTLINFQTESPSILNVPRESGFVPPVVKSGPISTMVKQEDYDYDMYDDDDSSIDADDWMPPAKRGHYDAGAIVIQPYNNDPNAPRPKTSNRRRRLDDANLTPDEIERRNVRRERNKMAAAKCRQRRVDLTNKLLIESEGLEEEQSKLENEIQMLKQQKEQLAFLLEAHNPVCSAKVTSCHNSNAVKSEKLDITYPSVLARSCETSNVGTTMATYQALQISHPHGTSRPNSLPIPATSNMQSMSSVTLATGVPITTPSSVFNFGLDSMMDGHTGLTPITGAPSCASQLQRNSTDGSSSPEALASPTTLMAL